MVNYFYINKVFNKQPGKIQEKLQRILLTYYFIYKKDIKVCIFIRKSMYAYV